MSAAAEARVLVAGQNAGTLATLSGGDPWASLVAYGLLPGGAPVLCVSTYAEHGRNLLADPRASLLVTEPGEGDPLERGRVTLSGRVERPEAGDARDAFLAAVPEGNVYVDFDDFGLWVLRVERVRWVGGFARMETIAAEDYAAG